MHLTDAEKRFTAVLIAVAAIAICLFGIRTLWATVQEGRDEVVKQELNRSFKVGETIVLDSFEDDQKLPSGVPYSAVFDWEGTMRLRVDAVTVYDNRDEAFAVKGDRASWFDWDGMGGVRYGGGAILMCDFTVENIDARSTSATKTGNSWFNITFLLGCDPMCEVVYFDGMPTNGDLNEGEGTYYEVKPGETKTYTVGYSIGDEAPERFVLHAGVNAEASDKYRLEWDVGGEK